MQIIYWLKRLFNFLFHPRMVRSCELDKPRCSRCSSNFQKEKGWQNNTWRCLTCGYKFRSKYTILNKEIEEGAYIPQIIGIGNYFFYRFGILPSRLRHVQLHWAQQDSLVDNLDPQGLTDYLNGCSCHEWDCEKCN